jgi:hypothetical protein
LLLGAAAYVAVVYRFQTYWYAGMLSNAGGRSVENHDGRTKSIQRPSTFLLTTDFDN